MGTDGIRPKTGAPLAPALEPKAEKAKAPDAVKAPKKSKPLDTALPPTTPEAVALEVKTRMHVPIVGSVTGLLIHEEGPQDVKKAAQAQVQVNDNGIEKEAEDITEEAHGLRDDLQADASAWLEELKGLEGKPGYKVSLRSDGMSRYAQATRYDAEGKPQEHVKLSIEGETWKLEETVKVDGSWFSTERECRYDERGGQHLKVEVSRYDAGPGSDSPIEDGFAGRAERVEHDALEITFGGSHVSRKERTLIDANGKGQKDFVRETSVSFDERPASALKLPSNLKNVFDLGRAVHERKVTVTEKPKGERTQTLVSESSFTQDHTRLIHLDKKNNPTILVEKEVDEGKKKVSQRFFYGSEKTEVSTTEVQDDGRVVRERFLLDSDGKPVDLSDPDAKRVSSNKLTQSFAADGSVAFSRELSMDAGTGAMRDESFRRLRDGDRTTEFAKVEVFTGAKTQTTTATRVTRDSPAGELLVSLETEGDGRKLALSVTPEGIAYRTTLASGAPVTGLISPGAKAGELQLKVNGKSLVLPTDQKAAAKLIAENFRLEERAGLDVALVEAGKLSATLNKFARSAPGVALHSGYANVMEAVDRFGIVWDGVFLAVDEKSRLSTVFDRIKAGDDARPDDVPLNGSGGFGLGNALDFLSVGFDAWDLASKVRNREYFHAATQGAKVAEKVAELGGGLFGKFGAATTVGRRMRAGRAALDVMEGAYAIKKGDTKFDRLRGFAKVASGGTRAGLALTLGFGPAAPVLFGALAVADAASFALRIADKHSVAPLAEGLVFKAPWENDMKWISEGPPSDVLDKLLSDSRADFKNVTPEAMGPISLVVDVEKQGQRSGATLKWRGKEVRVDPEARKGKFWDRVKGWTIKAGNATSLPNALASNQVLDHFGFPTMPLARGTAPLMHEDGTWQTHDIVAAPRLRGTDGDLDADPKNWSPAQAHMMMNYAIITQYIMGNNDAHLGQFLNVSSDHRGLVMKDVDSSFALDPDEMSKWEMQQVKLPAGLEVGYALNRAPSNLWHAYVQEDIDLNFGVGTEFVRRIASTSEAQWRELLSPLKGDDQAPTPAEFDALVARVMARAQKLPEVWAEFSEGLQKERGHFTGVNDVVAALEMKLMTKIVGSSLHEKHQVKTQKKKADTLDLKFVQPRPPPPAKA